MSLRLFAKKNRGAVVVRAVGEMDYHNSRALRRCIEKSLAAGERRFIFNLRGINYLDSSALGGLLYNHKKIEEHQGRSVLVPSDPISEILSLTHLESYFTITGSVEKAAELLSDDRPSYR